jgi:hypothetical protein
MESWQLCCCRFTTATSAYNGWFAVQAANLRRRIALGRTVTLVEVLESHAYKQEHAIR